MNIRKSHGVNKKYYDRKSKQRDFTIGDVVYLFNPARKRHQSKKLFSPWTGPFKITGKKSKLNYRIISSQGKETWVHVNRLKEARNPEIWKEPVTGNHTRQRPRRRRQEEKEAEEEEEEAEEEEAVLTRGPF